MRFCGRADESATYDEVLTSFEGLVRTELSEAVLSSRGISPLPYMDVLITTLANDAMFALDIWSVANGANLFKGEDIRAACVIICSVMALRVFYIPLHWVIAPKQNGYYASCFRIFPKLNE